MELLYFILGFSFASFGIPIIEGVLAWFLTWVEAKKAKQSEIVNQANIKMRQDAASIAEENVPSMRQIGFQVSDDDQEEEEDKEDEV